MALELCASANRFAFVQQWVQLSSSEAKSHSEVEAVELDVEVCLPMSVSFGFSKLSDLKPPRGARGGLSSEPSGANFFRGAKAGFLPIGPRGACQEETSISSSWWLPGISYQGHHGSVRLL